MLPEQLLVGGVEKSHRVRGGFGVLGSGFKALTEF